MNCNEIKQELPSLIYGELSEAECKRIENHLTHCETCRLEHQSLAQTVSKLDDWRLPSAVRDDSDLTQSRESRRFPWFSLGIGAAAAVLAFAALSLSSASLRYSGGQFAMSFGGREQPPSAQTENSNMHEYVLLLHETAESGIPVEDVKKVVAEYKEWAGELAQSGRLVGGTKLGDEGGRILSKSDGHIVTSNGDYSGEVIGGLFQIRAESYAAAVKLAETCPHMKYGTRIEIRQVDDVE